MPIRQKLEVIKLRSVDDNVDGLVWTFPVTRCMAAHGNVGVKGASRGMCDNSGHILVIEIIGVRKDVVVVRYRLSQST